MTTSQDKLKDQINSKGRSATTRGVHPDGTGDPRGQNPTPQYDSKSSINAGSRGSVKHQLGGYAGIPGVDVTKFALLPPGVVSVPGIVPSSFVSPPSSNKI